MGGVSVYEAIDARIHRGTSTLDGPDGDWSCSFGGIVDPRRPVDELYLSVCSGTEDYEGLTYVFYWNVDSPEGFGDGSNILGLIYEGDPPPLWGPSLHQLSSSPITPHRLPAAFRHGDDDQTSPVVHGDPADR